MHAHALHDGTHVDSVEDDKLVWFAIMLPLHKSRACNAMHVRRSLMMQAWHGMAWPGSVRKIFGFRYCSTFVCLC